MRYSAALAALASVVAAVPSGIIDIGDGVKLVPREPRAHARVERLREYRRNLMGDVEGLGGQNVSDVSYDSNWAGAVKIGTGLDEVTGTIVSVYNHMSAVIDLGSLGFHHQHADNLASS